MSKKIKGLFPQHMSSIHILSNLNEAWRAAVRGVTKSQTGLSNWTEMKHRASLHKKLMFLDYIKIKITWRVSSQFWVEQTTDFLCCWSLVRIICFWQCH